MFSGWGGDELVSMNLRGLYNHFFFRLQWLSLAKYMRRTGIGSAWPHFVREILRYLTPAAIRRHAWLPAFHKRNKFMGYGSRMEFCGRLIDNFHMQYRIESWAIKGGYHGVEYRYTLQELHRIMSKSAVLDLLENLVMEPEKVIGHVGVVVERKVFVAYDGDL